MKKPKKHRKGKPAKGRAKLKSASRKKKSTRAGLPFELRAQRAISQVRPELVITHDERLPTEYGVMRQFDVVGRTEGRVLKLLYEARDHGRKVGIEQQEGFAKKVENLVEKPQRAGIISASGFTSSPVKWVQRYGATALATELYTLRPSTAEDWAGDIRELLVHAQFHTVRVTSVRLLPTALAEATGGTAVATATDRWQAFIYNASGKIIDNLVDVTNNAAREALVAGDMSRRRLDFPDGVYVEIGGRRSPFAAVEIELEQVTIPAQTRVDFAERFPDTLHDVITGHHCLIEDRERLPRFARRDRHLTLAFTDPNDPSFANLDDLPLPEPDPETGSSVESTIASLQLTLALSLAGGRAEDIAPPALADLLTRAQDAFTAGDFDAAETLYLESLNQGTALSALCNLAYLTEQRADHSKAKQYSLQACCMFPMQPYGFTNAAAACLAAGETAEARRILEAGRPLHGAAAVFRRQEADLLVRERRWHDAARLYYELVLDDPSNGRIRACLARCEAEMGHVQAAAWEARRALADAPRETVIAELASRYAAESGDSADVIEVANHATSAELDSPSVYLRALDLALAANDHVHALQWLDRIPRATWSPVEYRLSGQLASLTGERMRAVDDLSRALASPETAEEARPWLAENLHQEGRFAEALAVLGTSEDAACLRLRTLCLLEVGELDEALAVLGRMEPGVADQLGVELLGRAYSAGQLVACNTLTTWLMARNTKEPTLLLRQSLVLGSNAILTGDASALRQAEGRLTEARAAGAAQAELRLGQIMVEIACGNEPAALELIKDLPAEMVEIHAMFTQLAERRGLPALQAHLLDRCLAAERVPANLDISGLLAQRIACGFRLGQELPTVRAVLGTRHLSNDMWARTAAAALSYADGDLEECVGLLAPLMAAPKVPFPAPNLLGQALAELRRYDDLRTLCSNFGAPELAELARWAAERTPARPLEPAEVGMASAAAFIHESEILGVARKQWTVRSAPSTDWATAIRACRKSQPDSEQVWVVRRSYPREFLRRVFTPQNGPRSSQDNAD